MEDFCAKTLAVPEMSWMAEHMGDCQACRKLFNEVFDRRRNYAPIGEGMLKLAVGSVGVKVTDRV